MQIAQPGLDLITSSERYHRELPNGDCTTYYCPAGVLTIGWGCTHGITDGMVWTRQQAQDAFRAELSKFETAVNRLITVEISQNQYDALVSFAYNCGEGALPSVLKLTNAGKPVEAAKIFALWNKARKGKGGPLVVMPGLVSRRAAEAALYLKPDPEAILAAPSMPQAVELPGPKEAHLEAHAELNASSMPYSLVGKGIGALRWLGPGGALGVAGKKAMEGGSADALNVTPMATDMLGQVGAAAHLIAQYGLPFLAIALAGVLLLEGVRYWQRTHVVGATS